MRYKSILAIMILGLVMACQQASTQTQNQAPNQAKNTKAAPAPHADDDAKRISLKDAKAAYDAGTAFFVDTRAAAAYNSEHIKGSINIAAEEVDKHLSELPKDKQLIFYCS